MSLPVYFVCQAPQPPPGRIALCGWHCAPDGTLRGPEVPGRADALVFDDRAPLPDSPDTLTDALLQAAGCIGAEVIVLDFERSVSPCACRLAEALAARHRTAAPVRFCTGACEPIRCYSPAAQTFPEFLSTAGGWIELRPVRETVRYDIGGALPSGDGQDFFSELLQCRYRARQTADGLLIELFDSPESFRARTQRLSDSFTAALALQWELTASGYPNDSK